MQSSKEDAQRRSALHVVQVERNEVFTPAGS